VFVVPNLIAGSGQIVFTNASIGPCPNCGGTGKIPDGLYEFTGSTLSIFSSWHPDRLRKLADALGAARRAPDPRAAVEQTLASDPELASLAKRLSPLRDASAFWGFIAVLIATITLLTSQTESDPPVTEQTVIEKVIVQPEQPRQTHIATDVQAKKPPPPPPRKKDKQAKKRRGKRR
jgi:hypothetical protein